jgi:L-lactate dehydrogenase
MPGNEDRIRSRRPPKVSIIGAGMVGSSLAYSLVVERVASQIVLLDINRRRAEGEAMDINHAVPFSAPTTVLSGDYEDCRDSDVIVITAGLAQAPGQTRLDLVGRNVTIFRDIVPKLVGVAQNAIIVIVSNPVDVLTYATVRISGLPKERIVGAGTILDTARLRYELGAHCHIDPRNVHGYILGEHGDTEVPIWSTANIAGVMLLDYCAACGRSCRQEERDEIFRRVRTAAYEIIDRKGATYYAIALGTTRLIEAILRDQNTVATVSTLLEGEYGIEDVCLSVPAVIGRGGIDRVIHVPLSAGELKALRHSAQTLKDVIAKVGL